MQLSRHSKALVLFFTLIAAITLPSLASAEFWLYKAYAGPFQARSHQMRKEALQNAKANIALPNVSVIDCKAGRRFGVAYFVQPSRTNVASMTYTWHHPHFEDQDGRTSVSRHITIKQLPGAGVIGLEDFVWKLEPSELLDGDFILEVRDKERLLLAHKFEIRGCEEKESED